ncbi:flavodoxin family protein [uncultured Megasphaera sp.]|uniref:flavodoxin family protein n=1 Tax=uncultured Megasphaera sp. TaxID=165188 RepID=UPI0025F481A3|nr:NAD(P)H-dependent oxidoreductase [uncultured Megasphaera sp.]
MFLVVKVGWSESGHAERIHRILDRALAGRSYQVIDREKAFLRWCVRRPEEKEGTAVLFAVALPKAGVSLSYVHLVSCLVRHRHCLAGCRGAVLVDGQGEFFTKKIGRELIFFANQAGCLFPGKPLVEATGSLYNFNTQAKIQGLSNEEAYAVSAGRLVNKLLAFSPPERRGRQKDIVVIHASSRKTSNTLLLWEMVKHRLSGKAALTEISLRNGSVVDCRGCSYETCLHFGEKGDCFYGGVMVEKVYPAVRRADAVVLICPNYNDAVSANITAFFNRLTALFRKEEAAFASKEVYALVVSGYSGGDIVAEQILDAMNCNKNFILPPYFALIETANDPRSILKNVGIEERAARLAERIVARNEKNPVF